MSNDDTKPLMGSISWSPDFKSEKLKNVSRPAAPELMEEPAIGGPDAIDRLEASVRELRAELAKRDAIRASTTEEILAEALRKVDFMLTDVDLAPNDIRTERTFINSIHAVIDAALAAYDQARAGQQQTDEARCLVCRRTDMREVSFGVWLCNRCQPDAGSVGQARWSPEFVLSHPDAAGVREQLGLKPDPQPAPKCQTCGGTQQLRYATPYGIYTARLCPDCSKPTGGTP